MPENKWISFFLVISLFWHSTILLCSTITKFYVGTLGHDSNFFYCFSEGEEMALQTQNELLLRLISKIRSGLSYSAFFKNRNTVRKKLCEAITWWLNTENVISKKMGDFVFCTPWHFSKFYWIHYCRSSLGIRILSQGRVCDFFLLRPPPYS